ncbi:MAG: TonB-dependent receptor [Gammaproteobacteria bacterium]|nr:TonB-dependent receptor [Gammaproteobacteria bacterium]
MRSAALAILITTWVTTVAAGKDTAAAEETVVVTTTRVPSLVGDEPLRIEAVPSEEIEENLTVQPGNISTLLNELPSARIQSAGPGLGGVGLQLRGMPTRHTLVLTDGLPSLGAEPDDFGLLQTPPLDLQRIEVIKGAASALFGGSALGGVLNIVSKSPREESAVLANATSRDGRDLEGFFTNDSLKHWTGTLMAGVHDQSRQDVNGDGWADVPGYRRYSMRPRIWWNEGQDQSLFLTGGITEERREGGTMLGRVLADGAPFAEILHTRRFDGGAVGSWKLGKEISLQSRLSITSSDLDRTFGVQRIASTQSTIFSEQALNGDTHGHQWTLGVAFQHSALRVPAVPGVGYTYNVPGIFAQDEFSPLEWMKVAAAARVDSNNQYGTFASPRLSALLRQPASPWSLRASVGGGFAAPTPFVEEVEAAGLGALMPLRGLHAERAVTESLDGKWAARGWDINVSVFNSEIHNPLAAQAVTAQKIELVNAPGPRRAPGAEILIHYVTGPLQMIGSWSYIDATQATPQGPREPAPLVPRHSAELGGILESQTRGRIGLEVSYTGRQGLEDDPYRTLSRPYIQLNALAELRFRGFSVFLNALNLTGTRQTNYDPLLRPTPGRAGDPITDVWAPLDGRTFNIGIRTGLEDHAIISDDSSGNR